jgi:hypothetical protein
MLAEPPPMPDLVLVHDYLLVLRGAERTFAAMTEIWPRAPIATLLYDESGTHGRFARRTVRTSPLQRLGIRQHNFRAALPAFPTAVRRLDVGGSGCIVSSSSAFAHGVRKWGKPSVEVEQAIIDGGERQVSQLRKHLRILNGVATVSPLMGLLGTVVGMIIAFNQIASAGAMGKAEELAVGIALALVTTAIGLTIAIPSLILYMYLAGRVDAPGLGMDQVAPSAARRGQRT